MEGAGGSKWGSILVSVLPVILIDSGNSRDVLERRRFHSSPEICDFQGKAMTMLTGNEGPRVLTNGMTWRNGQTALP